MKNTKFLSSHFADNHYRSDLLFECSKSFHFFLFILSLSSSTLLPLFPHSSAFFLSPVTHLFILSQLVTEHTATLHVITGCLFSNKTDCTTTWRVSSLMSPQSYVESRDFFFLSSFSAGGSSSSSSYAYLWQDKDFSQLVQIQPTQKHQRKTSMMKKNKTANVTGFPLRMRRSVY